MKASAVGKIILFGEHAVVYGRAALAVPVTQVRAEVEVLPSPQPGIWIEAPDVQLHAELKSLPSDHPLAAVIHNLLFALSIDPFPDLSIRVTSTIPVAAGLGSGAAVSVALLRVLAAALNRPLTDDQVSAYAFEIEKLHHGTPSGIDNAVVTRAQPVYFVRGQPPELLRVPEPFTIVIGHTGIAAPTREAVADVRRLWERAPQEWDVVFDGMQALANMAREAIEGGLWRHVGPLMDENHKLLQRLTVSSVELDRLVLAARRAGALGAKLSGGGRGGNMIALAPESGPQPIADALTRAGATRVIISTVERTV